MSVVTVWDGKFIQHREKAQAEADLAAGLVQIFAGPQGYIPGFMMAMGSSFPLPAHPAATLDSLAPNTAVQNTGNTEITLTGTNFRVSDTVLVDGAPYPSIPVSDTTKTISINVAGAKVYAVAVRDAAGRTTAEQDFTVTVAAAARAGKAAPPAPPVVEPDPLNDE